MHLSCIPDKMPDKQTLISTYFKFVSEMRKQGKEYQYLVDTMEEDCKLILKLPDDAFGEDFDTFIVRNADELKAKTVFRLLMYNLMSFQDEITAKENGIYYQELTAVYMVLSRRVNALGVSFPMRLTLSTATVELL